MQKRIALIAALAGLSAHAAVKWSQPPDLSAGTNFNGWTEYSIQGSTQLVADAWVNADAVPVGKITWWGAFQEWRETNAPPDAPAAFDVVIWQHNESAPPFPQPTYAIWAKSAATFTSAYVGQTLDPRADGAATVSVFRFEWVVPEADWLQAQPGDPPLPSNLWVSISASSQAGHPFGWLTRPASASPATSGAVRVWSPNSPRSGDLFASGEPVQTPTNVPWNASFVLEGPPPATVDFGDAPSSCPVLLSQNGARHTLVAGVRLGVAADAENDGQPSAAADGDDAAGTDDEDGVTFGEVLLPGATVTITVNASTNGYLGAWFDWNRDNDWDDFDEQVASGAALTAGVNGVSVTVPGNLALGPVNARFRFATGAADVAAPVGAATSGEVEDYQPAVTGYDFGDAPSGYPVQVIDNGARHLIALNVWLGLSADAEADGQPSAAADGDDLAGGIDDEDGVTLDAVLAAGQGGTVRVVAASSGYLGAWIDWNRDGDWSDGGEQAVAAAPLVNGQNELSIVVPLGVTTGAAAARFRFASAAADVASPAGAAADGEVEDYLVTLEAYDIDWGDAPTNYPVTFARGGARHRIVPGEHLGAGVDADTNGQPSAAADGDDLAGTDDEDGVLFDAALVAGQDATVRVAASVSGFLGGWFDWNRDGDWDDAGENPLSSIGLNVGTNALTVAVPSDATAGSVAARFRFSPGAADVGAPVGFAASGEVEDHVATVIAATILDGGDAPTAYPVTLAQDGARHVLVAGIRLGAAVDGEADGQPSAAADGDDLAGVDDEDGVQFNRPLLPGQDTTVTVTAAVSGYLNAWFDWNRDGDWDDENENVAARKPLGAGGNAVPVFVPAGAAAGAVWSRFRFTSTLPLYVSPLGQEADGEVEDHQATVAGYDFGDAPASYPVTVAQDGARHAAVPGIHLGAAVDDEADGQPSAAANGDDLAGTDDEEGVILTGQLLAGVRTNIQVTASTGGFLSGWFDWNADGDWGDAGEQAFTGVVLSAGANILGVSVPADATPGNVIARFRCASSAASLVNPFGFAPDGEVEDHRFAVSGVDFGDAPSSYPVQLSQNGARHIVVPGLFLGTGVDVEGDGQPAPAVDGDDVAGSDDEDGVSFLGNLLHGNDATVRVGAAASGRLGVWFDWNRDGDWADAGEQVVTGRLLTAGSNDFVVRVPAQAEVGPMPTRFRFATAAADVASPTGLAADGEVEDHQAVVRGYDFGDAPTNYPVTLARNGARHLALEGVKMGAIVDAEWDGQPSPDAEGDDMAGPDDEDGITITDALAAGGETLCVVTVSTGGYLGVWFDWNRDGDWADAGEQAVTSAVMAAGANNVGLKVPRGTAAGPTFARFRFATAAADVAAPVGPASDGEIEDHRFVIEGVDYGDAPTNYPVLKAQNGASHAIVAGVHLGAAVDGDGDGLPSAGSDGDDLGGLDDEDGVTFGGPLLAGSVATVRVTAAASGFLGSWFDWNRDGDWGDPGENPIKTNALAAGDHDYGIAVPAGIGRGAVPARFRFASVAAEVVLPTGAAASGEVEDYSPLVKEFDFGDAPAPYPVRRVEDGARHALSELLLGTLVDSEEDGVYSNQADADDLAGVPDDEDGVVLPATWNRGELRSITVNVSTTGLLHAWLDLNRDGDWDDPGDQIAANIPMVPGSNAVTLTLSMDAVVGPSFARFRLSTMADLAPTGEAPDGEVEDYLLVITQVPPSELSLTQIRDAGTGVVVGVHENGDAFYQLEGATNGVADQDWRPKSPLLRSPVTEITDTNNSESLEVYRVVAPYGN